MAREICYEKAAPSYFRDYGIANLLIVLFQIHAQCLIPTSSITGFCKTILPGLIKTTIEPHRHKCLYRFFTNYISLQLCNAFEPAGCQRNPTRFSKCRIEFYPTSLLQCLREKIERILMLCKQHRSINLHV